KQGPAAAQAGGEGPGAAQRGGNDPDLPAAPDGDARSHRGSGGSAAVRGASVPDRARVRRGDRPRPAPVCSRPMGGGGEVRPQGLRLGGQPPDGRGPRRAPDGALPRRLGSRPRPGEAPRAEVPQRGTAAGAGGGGGGGLAETPALKRLTEAPQLEQTERLVAGCNVRDE